MTRKVAPGQLWSGGFGDEALLLYTLKLIEKASECSWQCLILHGAGRYRDGSIDVWCIDGDAGYFQLVG